MGGRISVTPARMGENGDGLGNDWARFGKFQHFALPRQLQRAPPLQVEARVRVWNRYRPPAAQARGFLIPVQPRHLLFRQDALPPSSPSTGNLISATTTNTALFARPAFDSFGDLFVAYVQPNFSTQRTQGALTLERLQWDAGSQQWSTIAAGGISGGNISNDAQILDSGTDVKFKAQLVTPQGTFQVSLAAEATPGLAVGNVGNNSDPIVYVSYDTDSFSANDGLVDDRQVQIGAVDGFTDLSVINWHGPYKINNAFHSSLSMSGSANVLDAIYMQATVPSTSLSTQIQTYVQRFDASDTTTVGSPVPVVPIAPTLNDLPARRSEGSGFTPGSLFIGEYEGLATLGVNGFVAAAPTRATPPDHSTAYPTNVQMAINIGSQKCDPVSAVLINRQDSFWQCDNCNCGSDGVQNMVGCVPGSVTDAATVCATLCGGTACGQSLSCAHNACRAPASGASATRIAANSCNTHGGPYLISEPSDLADYQATDNGTSTMTVASGGFVFTVASPGTVSINLSESPPRAGSEIEIARINLHPGNFTTPEIDETIGPCPACITKVIEPSHLIHDVHLVHGQRVYGAFADATHFQIALGAADFCGTAIEDSTPIQEFQSNTAPVNGTFDLGSGIVSLDVTIGDPTADGAEANFNGTLTRKPSYNCMASIPPVIAPLSSLTLQPCYEGASVAIPLPQVTDLCTPQQISIKGEVVSINGVTQSPTIPITRGLLTVPSGDAVVLWTASDANGATSTATQNVSVRAKPTLYTTSQLEIDDGTSVLVPGGYGTVANAGTGQLHINSTATVGYVQSHGTVFLGDRSVVHGSVISLGTITPQNNVVVTGTYQSGVQPEFATAPIVNTTFPNTNAGDYDLEPDQTGSRAPGSYGNVAVKSRAVLGLRTGTYYFVTLDLEPQAIVTLDQTAGPVVISVKSNIIYNESFTDLSRQLTNVDLTYLGTNGVFINTPFLGVIRAPNAKVTLASLTTGHIGEFFAKDIEVSPHTTVTARPFTCILP